MVFQSQDHYDEALASHTVSKAMERISEGLGMGEPISRGVSVSDPVMGESQGTVDSMTLPLPPPPPPQPHAGPHARPSIRVRR